MCQVPGAAMRSEAKDESALFKLSEALYFAQKALVCTTTILQTASSVHTVRSLPLS